MNFILNFLCFTIFMFVINTAMIKARFIESDEYLPIIFFSIVIVFVILILTRIIYTWVALFGLIGLSIAIGVLSGGASYFICRLFKM